MKRPEASTLLGQRIRNFAIKELLGKGGMGEVYLAFDEVLERHVAVKSIRNERRLKDEDRARFLREARMLSRLEHPHICQIFDYIENEERDLIVLELIQGKSLRHAIKEGLDEATAFRVAEQISSVLVAAHGQGIIHRDLKPDNIMVTDDLHIKVLDFGLSRPVSAIEDFGRTDPDRLRQSKPIRPTGDLETSETLATPTTRHTGSVANLSAVETKLGTIMGSPGYMSPEQARGEAATAASDMYSVGIVLQELFTGEAAYEPAPNLPAFIARVQRAETRPLHGVDPDLAELIQRLTSRAPGARPSAEDTADRLEWIREKPKRKRRAILKTAATTLIVFFSIAMTVLSIQVSREAQRANTEARRANREAAVAEEVTSFLIDLFEVSDPGKARGNSITARELLDRGASKIDAQFENEPLVRGRLMHSISTIYGKLGLYNESKELLEKTLVLAQEELDAAPALEAGTRSDLGNAYRLTGDFDKAEHNLEAAVAIMRQHPEIPKSELAAALNNLANLQQTTGNLDDAVDNYRASLRIQEQELGPDHVKVGDICNNIAVLLANQGKTDEALELYLRVLDIWEGEYGADHPDVALVLDNLGSLYRSLDDLDAARSVQTRSLAIRKKLLGPKHPQVAQSLFNYAELCKKEGDWVAAEEALIESLAILEDGLGPDHPFVAYPVTGLAEVARSTGRLEDARDHFERALRILNKAYAPEHPQVKETQQAYESVLAEIHITP